MHPTPTQEDTFLKGGSSADEIAIIYEGGCVARAGRMRRLPFAARKVETGVIRMPVSKTRMKISKKHQFTSCGEATTFQTTFSGVAWRKCREMPTIPLCEKRNVHASSVPAVPAAPDQYVEEHGDDQPLFWQESKPIALFTALLQELNIQAVLGVTPGSGACMEAALTLGLPYHGFCINKDHMAWLQSVADRAACGIISVSGSSLYAQDLATAVKQQFPDLLQSLVPANDEDDEPLEPDSPADN